MKQLIAPFLLAVTVFVGAVLIGVFAEPPQTPRPQDRLPAESWDPEIVQLPPATSSSEDSPASRRGGRSRDRGAVAGEFRTRRAPFRTGTGAGFDDESSTGDAPRNPPTRARRPAGSAPPPRPAPGDRGGGRRGTSGPTVPVPGVPGGPNETGGGGRPDVPATGNGGGSGGDGPGGSGNGGGGNGSGDPGNGATGGGKCRPAWKCNGTAHPGHGTGCRPARKCAGGAGKAVKPQSEDHGNNGNGNDNGRGHGNGKGNGSGQARGRKAP